MRSRLLLLLFVPLAQLAAQSPEQLQELLKRFPDADANKDGTLTLEEAQEYRQKWQRERPSNARPALPTPTVANAHYGAHERQVLDFWRAPGDKPAPVLVFI